MTKRSRAVRAGVRAACRRDVGSLRAGCWALRASWTVHRRLARDGIGQVRLPRPPRVGERARATSLRTVEAVSSMRHLTCLESALVRRAWLAAEGLRSDIAFGVTAPSSGFTAHAWLDSDPVDPRFVALGATEHEDRLLGG